MVLGTIKRANIIDIILVPILSILNFLKGISLFARCSVFGLTIIEIPKLINAEITTNTNSVIISLDNNNVICLKSCLLYTSEMKQLEESEDN